MKRRCNAATDVTAPSLSATATSQSSLLHLWFLILLVDAARGGDGGVIVAAMGGRPRRRTRSARLVSPEPFVRSLLPWRAFLEGHRLHGEERPSVGSVSSSISSSGGDAGRTRKQPKPHNKEQPRESIIASGTGSAHQASTELRLRGIVPSQRRTANTLLLSAPLFSRPFGKGVRNGPALGCLVVTAAAVNAAQKALWSPPVRRAVRFWWVAGPIVAHYRFAQWWLDSLPGNNKDRRDRVYAGLHRRYCDPTFRLMLELRGLFVKVGQVLSSRPDFVPDEYVRLFASLQDSIPPWTIDCVKDVVDRSLQAEHGVTYEQVFESMDPIALGSASIGQVHRAVLRRKEDATNNSGAAVGREVAVKVMHPGAKDQFRHDFLIFRWLCRLALPTWMGLLNELERRMMTEFDYKNEAESLRLVRHNLVVERSSPYRNRVSVPEPVRHLCTQDVLVMELLRGRKLVDDVKQRLDQALGIEGAAEDLIRRRQAQLTMVINNKRERESDGDDSLRDLVDGAGFLAKLRMLSVRKRCQRYVDLLVDVHGHQIFVNGAFNGDPHPGNVLVLEDGRLGLIDFGQTRRLTDQERWGFARVVLALVEGSDDEEVAETLRRAGFASQDDNDATTLARYATLFFDSDHESRNLGFATPQLYYASLMRSNPLTVIPDAAIFIARTSFLFRGMGTVLGSNAIRTARLWSKHARKALARAQPDGEPELEISAQRTSPSARPACSNAMRS